MAAVDEAREAFDRRRWTEACELYRAAGALDPDDVERFATASFLIGDDAASADIWAQAHRAHLERGDPERAALAACWIAFGYINAGDTAQGGGWAATAARVLGDEPPECAALGFLVVFEALQTMFAGDAVTALPRFVRAAEIADACHDPNVSTLAHLGHGQCLIMTGEIASGVSLHDEVMVACMSGAVTPTVAGIVYCAVIESCQEQYDVRRAQEWTAALVRWCESQPDLVPYRGQCLVHRAQVMHQQGAWTDALSQAFVALEVLSQRPGHASGMAHYELGELHRLRGAFADAEDSYRRASDAGRTPQPGLALLQLAQGATDAASIAIRRAFDDESHGILRTSLLVASVEIELAAGDVDVARTGAHELAALAAQLDAPYVKALSARARGAVCLADGDWRAAFASLREAFGLFGDLSLPYEAARTRVLVAQARRALGDEEASTMELDAARRVFEDLGAKPDLDRLGGTAKRSDGLTARELEVLRLVSSGKTNRAVASELVLSEKTVARHVANIFTKLGVSSRAAATAYAYEHDLV